MTPIVMAMSAYNLCARCGTYTEHGYICELCAPRSADVRARHSDEHRAQDASTISRIQQRQVDIGGAYAQWSSLVSALDGGVVSADTPSRAHSSPRRKRGGYHRTDDNAISRRVRIMNRQESGGIATLLSSAKAPPALPFNYYPRSARR